MTKYCFCRNGLLLTVSVLLTFGTGQSAHASGFGLREGSADWTGNAYVGGEAKAYDAGTVYTNPAGMALLDRDELGGTLNYLSPSSHYSVTNTNPNTGGYVSGRQSGDALSAAASGGGFAVFILSPKWRLGVSINSPFGERASYDDNFVGRYQSLVTSITTISYGVMLSYKVNDHLSFGGGPVVNYFQARLTQALNIPGASAATGQDPYSDLHGSDSALGYNIGALYRFDDSTRIGVDYHSRIHHVIGGYEHISAPAIYSALYPSIASLVAASSSNGQTAITLPDSLGLGIYHQITPAWAVMGSLEWTDWSLFKQLTITLTDPASTTTIPENWRNTWFTGVGTNYQLTPRLMLQGGFAYDESPITDANRTTRAPESNHYDLGFGAQYKISSATTIQLAYAHIFSPGGTINNSAPSTPLTPAGTIAGSFSFAQDTLSLGVTSTF